MLRCGTISDGIYALDKKGKLIWKVNTDNKLQNNTVLRLYCDDDNNIWTALDEGIAYIHNNSLIYYYEPPFRKIGMVYDVLVRENEAYIASNQGLYWLKDGKTELVRVWKNKRGSSMNGENRFFAGITKELSLYRG